MTRPLGYVLAAVLLASAAAFLGWPGEKPAENAGGRPPKPVAAAPVQSGEIVDRLEAVGTVRAREAVTIAAETSGIVRAVLFADGAMVDKGAALVQLEAAEERARVEAAEVSLRSAERAFSRAQELRTKGTVAQVTVDEAASALEEARAQLAVARARLAERVIAAPFAGRLGFRAVSPGAFVEPGDEITTLDDLATVYVDFPIPESRLGAVEVGQDVTLRSAAYPDRSFTAQVVGIGSRVDPQSRQAQIRALADNPGQILRPGQLVSVRVAVSRRQAVLVPASALVAVGYQHFAFVVGKDAIVDRRSVQVGVRRDGTVSILSGLAEGEMLVVEGAAKLDGGDKVRLVPAVSTGGS